jgi:DNA-binding transcriptional MerR regulator
VRIGELSRRTGVSIRSLRYYEEQNLLHPERSTGGYRVFDDADVDRVRRIQVLLSAGLGTRRIEYVLPCLGSHRGDPVALACPDLYDDLVAERDDLLDRIDALQASVTALDAVIAASPRPTTT